MKTIKLLLTLTALVTFSLQSNAQSYQGSVTVNAGQNMTMSLYVDPVADTVQIILSGPDNVWFGYGFGGSIMNSTYAIVTDGNGVFTERDLGNHLAGTLLVPSFITSSNSVAGTVSTTTVTRSLSGLTGSYYTFTAGAVSIPIIWAYGTGTTLAYHGSGNRGTSTITLSLDCSNLNTAATIDTSVCDLYIPPSGSQFFNATGTYTDIIPNATGCDSVLTINLTVNKSDTAFLKSVCSHYVSPSGDIWDTTGVYTDTIPNFLGCDSIITVDLKVNNTDSLFHVTTCSGSYTSPSGAYTWVSTGVYNDTLPNALGCDSIITVDLVFPDYLELSLSPIVCGTYTSPSGNYTWTSTGTYFDTIPNPTGCDTAYTINLLVGFLNTTVTQEDSVLTAEILQADTYQWVDCDNGFSLIQGATDQVFTASQNGSYAVIITLNNCIDTSNCFTVDNIGGGSSGIGEFNNAKAITYYPNPTSGQITLDLNSTFDQIDVKLVSISGQVLFNNRYANVQQANFEIVGENGLYFVELYHQGELIKVLKVIKQ